MKKCFVISALVAGIAVGQSATREVDPLQEKNGHVPVVHGAPKQPLGNDNRTWGGKVLWTFPGRRDKTGRRRTEYGPPSIPEGESPLDPHIQTPTTSPESEYLRGIASALSIPVSKDDTPGDIAYNIKQCIIDHTERYRGEVLSDGSFELARSAIGIPADAETFKAYHAFIKKVAGKRILILDDAEKER